jgi:Txe/YoeB family toxin of Txe-Axe toxin-antitoxin module
MRVLWTFTAWQEYVDWQRIDTDAVSKINSLIEDIRRDPVGKGIGKPERLTGLLKGVITSHHSGAQIRVPCAGRGRTTNDRDHLL